MSDFLMGLALGAGIFGLIVIAFGWTWRKAEEERWGACEAEKWDLIRKLMRDYSKPLGDQRLASGEPVIKKADADPRGAQAWDLINEILNRRGFRPMEEGNVRSYNLWLIANAMAKLDDLASLRNYAELRREAYDNPTKEPQRDIDQDRLMGRPVSGEGSQGAGGGESQRNRSGPDLESSADASGINTSPEFIYWEDHRGQPYAWPARIYPSPAKGKEGTEK